MAIDLDQFITVTALNVSSVSVVFSSAVSSGSLLVAHTGLFNSLAGGKFSTITDNINAGGFTRGCLSTMASDTNVQAGIFYKLNISSGAGANTYRVSLNSSAGVNSNHSLCAVLYTGGPFTVGSTGSSNGTSTGPRGPSLTASSNPHVRAMSGVHNSTSVFNDTMGPAGGQANWMATVDPTNANQILAVGRSTGSSLAQQPEFSMTSSTRWQSNVVLFLGLGGAAAVTMRKWQVAVFGVGA